MNTQGSPFKREAEEDESGSNNAKKSKIELLKEEDHFAKLFSEALKSIMENMQVSYDDLQKGIEVVKEGFRYANNHRFTDIDFSKSENLCGYFYLFSQLNTEVSRDRILDALDKCEVLKSDLIGNEKNVLNVVSIGGGPGFDIVGMLSAFYEKVNCKKLNLTVVDKVKGWKSLLDIVKCLLLDGDVGDACSMFKKSNANLSFVCKDVTEADSQETAYSEVLSKADIILLVRIISVVPKKKRRLVCKDVVRKMKNGALLLFIESPKEFVDFKSLGLEQISQKLKDEFTDEDNFIIKGDCSGRFGYKKGNSNAQIFVYKKKHVQLEEAV